MSDKDPKDKPSDDRDPGGRDRRPEDVPTVPPTEPPPVPVDDPPPAGAPPGYTVAPFDIREP